MGSQYTKLPFTENAVLDKVTEFHEAFAFPQCLGAIDYTHIGIKQLRINPTDYINRKGRFSLSVQACCDHRHYFMDVVIKWLGSVHDTIIFANSSLNNLLKTDHIPPCRRQLREDYDPVPVFLLGDPAYSLMSYMMKEYTNGGSTPKEHCLGYRLCSARNVIACAFGRLKARFGGLRRTMDINMDDLPYVIYACFILHNFYVMNHETMCEDVISSAIYYDRDFQPQQQTATRGQGTNDAEGKKIRRILTDDP